MKVLFIARHFTYFRNYESVIAALAGRGHEVHLAVERTEELGGREMVERLAAAHPTVSIGWAPQREDRWATLATKLRLTIDYLRYLDAAYESTPKLRARARERVPRAGLWLADAVAGTTAGRRLMGRFLRAAERAIPSSRHIEAFLRDQRPDVVLLTPLIGVVASPQLDYLHSATALGRPTALCVWSWDHLSSKAIVRNLPDRLFVWNDTQRSEAMTLHGVPPDRIVVTGAQCFDQWFDRRPSTDRVAFCRKVGLPEDRPFLLYVCSALFRGSAREASFVRRWIRALRSSGLEPLQSAPVLVRPHPARMKEWSEVDLSAEQDATLWGRNPVDVDAKADYFDSLVHSAAVVGLNTSAFLEGAIAGRPVFTTLLPEHHENQRGTIHFNYLLHVGGGLLHTSETLGEHFQQLNEALQAPPGDSARSRRFVEAFIRPYGLDDPATPRFVEAVEALAAVRAVPQGAPISVRLLRAGLRPIAAALALDAVRDVIASDRDRRLIAKAETRRELDAAKSARDREKKASVEARRRHKAERMSAWQKGKATKRWQRRISRRIGLGR